MSNSRIEKLYQNFRKEIFTETDANQLILKTQELVSFCWMNYPVRFMDHSIEKKIETVMLPEETGIVSKGIDHIVYIATTLFEVGGHSRCILNFIENIKGKKHTVILTMQKKKLPDNISSVFAKNDVNLIFLNPQNNPVSKAKELRQQIREVKPERIFMLTHPNDLIPHVTFGNFKPCEITVYNHADHVFWLGGKWLTNVYDFRNSGSLITKFGRGIAQTSVVFLPVANQYTFDSKEKAKQNIGCSPDSTVIGTLTNITKVHSYGTDQSILHLIHSWAIAKPACTFIIIGITSAQFIQFVELKNEIPSNINCTGIVPDPEDYYRAFDFFVEPYPVGSGLGIIEACKYGAIPLFSAHPCKLAATYDAFHSSIGELFSENSSVKELNAHFFKMVELDKEQYAELSKQVQLGIYHYHRGENWVEAFLNGNQHYNDQLCTIDVEAEALFFQKYLLKTHHNLLNELLKLKKLVTRKMIFSLFFGKFKVFSIFSISIQNWKLIGYRFIKTG